MDRSMLFLYSLFVAFFAMAACAPKEILTTFDSETGAAFKELKTLVEDIEDTFDRYLKKLQKQNDEAINRVEKPEGVGDPVSQRNLDDLETLRKEDDAAMAEVARDFTHSLNIVQALIQKHRRSQRRKELMRRSEETQKEMAIIG